MMRKGSLLRRAQTIFSEEEYTRILAFLKKKKMRMYTFLKQAALEKMEREEK